MPFWVGVLIDTIQSKKAEPKPMPTAILMGNSGDLEVIKMMAEKLGLSVLSN